MGAFEDALAAGYGTPTFDEDKYNDIILRKMGEITSSPHPPSAASAPASPQVLDIPGSTAA
jgi:hypothetical protein